LYGLTEYEPIESFCESLAKIKSLEFDVIYTAHDRCALHKNHIDITINQLRNKLPKAENIVDIPELGKLLF
jgi:DNA-binding response OmpR family regulator